MGPSQQLWDQQLHKSSMFEYFTVKDWAKEGIKYLNLFLIVGDILCQGHKEWRFSLPFLLFLMYLYKHFLLSFTVVNRLSPRWGFTFLIFFLHNLTSHYSSCVVCLPLLPRAMKPIFLSEFLQKLPVTPGQFFSLMAHFLANRKGRLLSAPL